MKEEKTTNYTDEKGAIFRGLLVLMCRCIGLDTHQKSGDMDCVRNFG